MCSALCLLFFQIFDDYDIDVKYKCKTEYRFFFKVYDTEKKKAWLGNSECITEFLFIISLTFEVRFYLYGIYIYS